MNRLQLATLLSWAGKDGLQGRKRLQKVVFFLQKAGCALDCRFTLHHYGPYSRDVADACDEMVAAGLVKEDGGPASGDMQYSYTLLPATNRLLSKTPAKEINDFQTLGKELINEDIWPLELGSTVLFFHSQNEDWEMALTKACKYKKADPNHEQSRKALALAKNVVAYSGK